MSCAHSSLYWGRNTLREQSFVQDPTVGAVLGPEDLNLESICSLWTPASCFRSLVHKHPGVCLSIAAVSMFLPEINGHITLALSQSKVVADMLHRETQMPMPHLQKEK